MGRDLIVGFRALTEELAEFYSPGSLSVLDCRGRLPLTRQWHEGRRAWDAEEVRQFKAEKLAQREAKRSVLAEV